MSINKPLRGMTRRIWERDGKKVQTLEGDKGDEDNDKSRIRGDKDEVNI